MTQTELKELISFGREQKGVEFKSPGSRNNRAFFALVAKAMLGMSNRRDGGKVIIGVREDKNDNLILEGLSAQDLATWTYDDVANSIDEYADPSINFEMTHIIIDFNDFIVIEVREFDDIPVLCKKTYGDTLRQGACYVRPRRKPETTEIPSQADLRDLLDLSVEKRLRRFLSLSERAGVSLNQAKARDDSEAFNKQIKEFWS